jgi:hypothetical protein
MRAAKMKSVKTLTTARANLESRVRLQSSEVVDRFLANALRAQYPGDPGSTRKLPL